MSIARNFGPVAEQMSVALERYTKEELIDLLTHIVKTYVVEGTLPLKPDVGGARMDDAHLAGLSFPQLVLHLQMRLDHREWAMFSVSGEDVWVGGGGQRINLTGRSTNLPAPQPPDSYGEPITAPGQARSAPAQAAPPQPPPPPQPAEQRPATPAASRPAAGAQASDNDPKQRVPEPFSEGVEKSERFGMLEID